jgi:hypothetical protein
LPFAGYKDFKACRKAQIAKGKSPEAASKICGALQARTEGRTTASAAQIPKDFQAHFNRSNKTLDFLKQQGVIDDDDNDYDNTIIDPPVSDTSLDNQIPKPVNLSNTIYSDPESYSDKVTRLMDEYKISEEEAKQIVGKIIEDDMVELNRREYELTKQVQIEKAQADMITSEDAKEPQSKQQTRENVSNQESDNNTEQ